MLMDDKWTLWMRCLLEPYKGSFPKDALLGTTAPPLASFPDVANSQLHLYSPKDLTYISLIMSSYVSEIPLKRKHEILTKPTCIAEHAEGPTPASSPERLQRTNS